MQIIRVNLVNQLIELKEISGTFLSIDSVAVPVVVEENNLKTSVKDRFDKTKQEEGPWGASECRGLFQKPFRKRASVLLGVSESLHH